MIAFFKIFKSKQKSQLQCDNCRSWQSITSDHMNRGYCKDLDTMVDISLTQPDRGSIFDPEPEIEEILTFDDFYCNGHELKKKNNLKILTNLIEKKITI